MHCDVEIFVLFKVSPRVTGLTLLLPNKLSIFKSRVLFLFYLNGLWFRFCDIILPLRNLSRLFVKVIRVQYFFMSNIFCQTTGYFLGTLWSEYHRIWLFLTSLNLIPLNFILTFLLIAELWYTWHFHSFTMLWWDRLLLPNFWYLPVEIVLFNYDGFLYFIFISLCRHETTLCIINQIWFSLLRNI